MSEEQSLRKLVVGTAGHIDHGKSALIANLTDHHPDRLPEEQERNLTIDIGFSEYRLSDGYEVGIIDVPGHEKFIKNMVAGAASVDFVVFVVAADDGIMPQTREHFSILKNLGVERGICVITKIDLVEQILIDLIREELEELFQGTFMEGAPVCPVSNEDLTGLEAFRDTFDEYVRESPETDASGIFQMPIQRVFTLQGIGTIVTGVPMSGEVESGDSIDVEPSGMSGRIRGIQAHGRDLERAQAGHRTALNLADVHHEDIERGDVACEQGFVQPTRTLAARFQFDSLYEEPIEHWAPIRLHVGADEKLGRLRLLNKEYVEPGEEAWVQFVLENPVAAVPGEPFILRLQSPMITLGGGRILDTSDHRLKRWESSNEKALAQFQDALESRENWVEFTAESFGMRSFHLQSLARQTAVPEEEISRGRLRSLSGSRRYIHEQGLEEAKQNIQEELASFHKERPELFGLTKYELQERVGSAGMEEDEGHSSDENRHPFFSGEDDAMSADVFETALDILEEEGGVQRKNEFLCMEDHEVQLHDEQEKRCSKIRDLLKENQFQPPKVGEIYQSFDDSDEEIQLLLRHLKQKGEVVELQDDLCFLTDALEEAKDVVKEQIEKQGFIETGEFRDLLDTTRKFAIPMLEYFDRQDLTYRKGSKRYLKGS